jgi:transcriptional regulator with XRE-family HTH domain
VREFRRVIRLAMKGKGLTQQTLADRIGMTQPRLANFLSGRYRIRVDHIVRLADGLGIDAVVLFRAAEWDYRKAQEQLDRTPLDERGDKNE